MADAQVPMALGAVGGAPPPSPAEAVSAVPPAPPTPIAPAPDGDGGNAGEVAAAAASVAGMVSDEAQAQAGAAGAGPSGGVRRYRRPQYVSTLRERYEVIMWMREQESRNETGVPLKAIDAFPRAFQATHAANRVKARRWWNQRNDPALADLAVVQVVGKRPRTKARPGRGRKKADWVARVESECVRLMVDGKQYDAEAMLVLAAQVLEAHAELNVRAQAQPHRLDAAWARRLLARLDAAAANIAVPVVPVALPDADVAHSMVAAGAADGGGMMAVEVPAPTPAAVAVVVQGAEHDGGLAGEGGLKAEDVECA